MATILIAWTEEEQTFDRWVWDKHGTPERVFKSVKRRKTAAWAYDVPADNLEIERRSAQDYVNRLLADGDTRNLRVIIQ